MFNARTNDELRVKTIKHIHKFDELEVKKFRHITYSMRTQI